MALPTEPDLSKESDENLVRVKDRALSASGEGITIADARLPDRPLVYVNGGFERLTGYPRAEVLGRNCRFLHGEGTNAETVAEIREAVNEGRECTVEILNYRKDGTPFWNRLNITPVKNSVGDVVHFIGIQSDVSARRRTENELRRAKVELESALRELRRDLDLAAKVQQSFLPKQSPEIAGIRIAWEFQPCDELAGDLLNVFPLDGDRIAFYVLDVSGHGASAALLSVTLSRALSPQPSESILFRPEPSGGGFRIARPGEVAARLNERYQLDDRLSKYFTLIYGVLDVAHRRFDYVAAGHPGPIVVPQEGESRASSSTATAIGLLPGVDFEEATLSLNAGDRVYLYTDGITDAVDSIDEELGAARLRQVLEATRDVSLGESLREVLTMVQAWQGGDGSADDMSVLAMEI